MPGWAGRAGWLAMASTHVPCGGEEGDMAVEGERAGDFYFFYNIP